MIQGASTLRRALEPCQLIERSIIRQYREALWHPFITAVKRYELIQAGDKRRGRAHSFIDLLTVCKRRENHWDWQVRKWIIDCRN